MLGPLLTTGPRRAELAKQEQRAQHIHHDSREQRAASNDISMITRNPGNGELVAELMRIAQEEWDRFRQVVVRIHARGWALGPERMVNYVNAFTACVRKDGDRDERLVDRLPFSAMIEARSCERFKLLTEECPDPELRAFYQGLMESEAGHYATFIGFARKQGGRVDVDRRWKEFLAYEAVVVGRYGTAPTMHG